MGGNDNDVAQAGQTLGTSLLYLFFSIAGAPGWRLKDTIRKLFPSIASFLITLYGVHGCVLWAMRSLATAGQRKDVKSGRESFWKKVVATAVALARSFHWKSLLSPSLLVGNVGYGVATTFIGLLFYSV